MSELELAESETEYPHPPVGKLRRGGGWLVVREGTTSRKDEEIWFEVCEGCCQEIGELFGE